MRDDPLQNLIREITQMIQAQPSSSDPYQIGYRNALREVRARARGYVPAQKSTRDRVLKLGTETRVVPINTSCEGCPEPGPGPGTCYCD
jgi:hypothetical protein